jgi:TolA-binding protein
MPSWRTEVARISPSVLLLLLPVVSLAQAQQAGELAVPEEPQIEIERLTGPIPEHVAEFDAAHDRYVVRMGEFQDDARAYVDLIEKQKRKQIVDGYGRIIAGLRDDEDALRTLAKARFEDFLLKYPRSEASPHVMFRLAELYYEDAENSFLVADSNYNDRLIEYDELLQELMSGDPAALEELPEPPEPAKKDYTKALALYSGIASDYPRYENIDGVYYMLGYCLTEENARFPDIPRGLDAMKNVVVSFPDSQFINDASMRLGEYYFNEANDLTEAVVHYQRIVDAGEDARYYDKGLYKLAWSHYRLASAERFDEYFVAMGLFVKLLDYSDRLMLATGEQSSMKPEAIQYAAISFADMSDLQSRSSPEKISPLTVAEQFFEGVGQREYEQDIYVQLADVLTRQARYMEAIEAYEYLQVRWPDDPANPEHQNTIAKLYMSLPTPDPVASADAERVLVDRYNDSTPWWEANRANPDALAVARGFTEQSTANVAKDLHIEAQQTGDPALFSKAADKYREYLLRFPFADDYYQMEWYLADALFQAKRLEEAEKEFLQLLKTDNHEFGDGALFLLMQTRRQMLVDTYGKVEARPDNAIVERVEKSEFGAEIPVYMLTDDHKDFVEVADRIVDTVFTDAKFVGPREENLAALTYLPGQIFFEFGHYDEARERLRRVVEHFHGKKEREYAQSLIIRTYQEENDLEKIAEETAIARRLFGEEANEEWGPLEEGARFKIAGQYAERNDYAMAAELFLKFMRTYPESQFIQDAHFNAANNLEKNGQVDQAIGLFEEFINKYEEDDRSEGLYFRIAGNYAQILELETAVKYYDNLVRYFPESQNAAAAIYNAAFLRIGMGEHKIAAQGLERYATKWPENDDAERTFYLAGNEWEQVSERDALDFYRRYLRTYGDTDVNHALTAQYRIIKILEQQGQKRSVEREWVELESMFVRFAEAGETIPGAGRKAAAEGSFPALWAQYEEFRQVKFTGDQEKDAPMLVQDKPEALKALGAECLAFIQKYQDFTYSSAALYIQAAAHFDYAQMLWDAPVPKGFTADMEAIYREELDKLRIPVEDKGKALALRLLEQAEKDERWSEWQSKTLGMLNQRFPTDFPAEKIEVRYAVQPQVEMRAGPIDIDVPLPEPPEPPPAATEPVAPAPAAPATPGGE